MRALLDQKPTAEQLTVITEASPGITLILGAAGSGKTSTALWRLKFLVNYWRARVADGFIAGPVRVLVLTFNRTLRGYVEALARGQITSSDVELEVATFGRWGHQLLGYPQVQDAEARARIIGRVLGRDFPWQPAFIVDEVDYVLGRYIPEDRARYLVDSRVNRGSPSLSAAMKRRVYEEIVMPYCDLKARNGLVDWQDEACQLATQQMTSPYHVVVVDESQDFSANQVRAILNHCDSNESSLTFVLDATQRIYPHSFQWSDVGLTIPSSRRHRLRRNYRNTAQIAQFCRALVAGLTATDDGTIPNASSCTTSGPKPLLVPGKFDYQMDVIIPRVARANSRGESTAILHARGGQWFDHVRRRLNQATLPYVELSGQSEWPEGDENVALITMASAKGLEFDHVCVVGLNEEVTPHGSEEGDDLLQRYRRLLAMAAGRARKSVVISYKPTEASSLINYFGENTYEVFGE